MPNIRCRSCGLMVQVPAGGRRLCGCGAMLSADEAPTYRPAPVEEDAPEVEPVHEAGHAGAAPGSEGWPRIEGDLSAIERLNDGYRRIRKELAKSIVGQERVIEELLISVFARGHCLLVGV